MEYPSRELIEGWIGKGAFLLELVRRKHMCYERMTNPPGELCASCLLKLILLYVWYVDI